MTRESAWLLGVGAGWLIESGIASRSFPATRTMTGMDRNASSLFSADLLKLLGSQGPAEARTQERKAKCYRMTCHQDSHSLYPGKPSARWAWVVALEKIPSQMTEEEQNSRPRSLACVQQGPAMNIFHPRCVGTETEEPSWWVTLCLWSAIGRSPCE